jgi:hypothetical protein
MAKKSLKSRVKAALSKSYNQKAATTVAARKNDTVAQAKTMLGSAYNPNTKVTESVQQTTDRANAMLAQTKAQGSNPFAGSAEEKAYLAKYQPPTSADKVAGSFPSLTLPNMGPDLGNISDATAGSKGLQAMIDIQKQQAQDMLALEQERQSQQKGLLDKFMGSVTSPMEARQAAIKETGIDPQDYFAQQEKGIKEIESLTNDYNKVVEAKDAQVAMTQDKMGSMNFINNQTAQIERNAAPQLNRLSAQINAKAATLQALQGNFAEARSYINQAVQDATADTKFKYDMMKATYDMNEDSFNRIDSVYKTAYQGAMQVAQMQYEQEVADKRTIGELILQYNADGAGIMMTDSLEEAYAKAGITNTQVRRLTEAQIANTWSNAMTSSARGGVGASAPAATPETAPMTELLNLVLSGKPQYEQQRVVARYNEYVANGNLDAAQQLVNDLAVDGMTAEQKNRFTGFGIINSVFQNVKSIENQFAQTNPGVYRTLLEQAKPWAQMSTDPRWQQYVSQVQGAVNAYRNEIFGASLTGNELKAANISLPDWNRDNYQTIMSKLNAMGQYAGTVRESVLRDTTGQYTSSALGQVTPQSVVETTSVYDSATGQQSEGGWFSRFLSWLR